MTSDVNYTDIFFGFFTGVIRNFSGCLSKFCVFIRNWPACFEKRVSYMRVLTVYNLVEPGFVRWTLQRIALKCSKLTEHE